MSRGRARCVAGEQGCRRLASPSAATVLGVAAAAFAVAALALSLVADHKASNAGVVLIPTTMFAAVGVVVARRQPANPMGWLLILAGLFENMFAFATAYVVFNHWRGHGLNWSSIHRAVVRERVLGPRIDHRLPSPAALPRRRRAVASVAGDPAAVRDRRCVSWSPRSASPPRDRVRFHDLQVDGDGQPVDPI